MSLLDEVLKELNTPYIKIANKDPKKWRKGDYLVTNCGCTLKVLKDVREPSEYVSNIVVSTRSCGADLFKEDDVWIAHVSRPANIKEIEEAMRNEREHCCE